MKVNKYFVGNYVYWLAFLFALALRLFHLGAASLSESEAVWALQALGLARDGSVTLGPQPANILLTSQLFSLFGNTNFMARLFPALAGSLIVWLPACFRGWMGESSWLKRAGVVLAFGLALDPALVALSRQAGSLMPAVAFTLLTFVAIYNQRMVWAGVFAGLALLSGPSFLQGLIILGVTWGFIRLVGRKRATPQSESGNAEPPVNASSSHSIRPAIPAFVLTLLFAGTLFLRAPQGFGGLADSLPAYLRTWTTPSGIPVVRLPASLLVYQPLVLIFALIALVRAWFGRQDDGQVRPAVFGLGIWALIAILLPFLYAGRQVGDLAWALIPLWILASLEISRSLLTDEDRTTRLVAACLALFLFVLAVVGWIRLLSVGLDQENVVIYWATIIGAFIMGFIAMLLVAAGWSVNAARVGVAGSLCLVLGLQLISNTVGMAYLRQNGAQELWFPSPAPGQTDLLLATLTDLSSWNTGQRAQLEIVALDNSPALMWALRDFPNARFETALSSTESPPVVITLKGTQEPILAEKYRGQDFVWSLYPGWQGAFPPDFVNWLAFRSAPLTQSQVILWARADIFPGGASEPSGSTTP